MSTVFSSRILLDSIGLNGARLTTFEITFPRFILAEVNTHKILSRNSASSRAIPFNKMIERLRTSPFFPTYWGKNQKGMQAEEELSADAQEQAHWTWKVALDNAAESAQRLCDIGVHKQITNRLIEPFMPHTVVITGTEWGNFFNLRCHKDAQPEFQRVAQMMYAQYLANSPKFVPPNSWHRPFVSLEEADSLAPDVLNKVSVARCARVSYLTHDGKRDIAEDLSLYARLVDSGHMSPTEHVAMAMNAEQWEAYATQAAMRWIKERVPMGNLWGWLQFRKMIDGEHDMLGHLKQVAAK